MPRSPLTRLDRSLPLLLLIGLLACPARADEPKAAGSTVPSEPVFSALRTDGQTVSGRIRQLGPRQEVVLEEGGKEQTIPLCDLVKLTKDGPPPAAPPEGTMVLFPDGDRLRAVIGSASETSLETRSYVLGDLAVPLACVLGVVFTTPTEVEALEKLLAHIREQPRKSEVLWLVNGDRLTGGFLGLSSRTLKLQPDAGPVTIERSQVVALGFEPALVEYPRPEGDYHELTLVDGSRLGVSGLTIQKGQVSGTTRFGAPIKLAIGDLARVHVRSGSIAYLSDRKADESVYVTYVGPARAYRRDATVDGHGLRLAGQPYDRGLGTQSRTLLAYRLRPGDRRFQALVGLDDLAGPLGNVIFRVSVDGKDRFVSPPMSQRDTPREVNIDVAGGKVLILVTEFGERGDVCDLADWVEARLIR